MPGAKAALFPGFIEPSIPTLAKSAPAGARWIYEIKHDGYRAQAHIRAGTPRIFTRRGFGWTHRFGSLAAALAALPANNLVLDGEVMVPDARGAADFTALQADLSAGRSDRMLNYAFDILHLDGFDLRAAPLIERKRVLEALLAGIPAGPLVYNAQLEGDGSLILDHACGMGLEGIVCKLAGSAYRSGRTTSWVKFKCARRAVLPIIGFVAAPGGIAALYVGQRQDEVLLYAGKVGTGFTRMVARSLRNALEPLVIDRPALAKPVRKPHVTWVQATLEAEVEFGALTAEGRLRHASFKGLRQRQR